MKTVKSTATPSNAEHPLKSSTAHRAKCFRHSCHCCERGGAVFRLLAPLVLLAICSMNTARADYHVATAQQLQNALTLAAASSVSNNIYVTNGYYTGNFNFNSSNVNSLTVLAEPGVSNTQITIDSGGSGSSMSISASASAYITVQGMTFLRNCGSTSIGGLRIAGGYTTILVSGCQFLSPTNSSGIGLLLVSGVNATVTNCTVAGSATGGGGIGISISGITNNVTLQNSSVTTNFGGGINLTGASVTAVANNLFSGNFGAFYSSGAYCSGTTITLSGNTFISNSTANSLNFTLGGGAGCSGTTITLSANTFIGNTDTGTPSSSGGNGVGGGAGCFGTTITLLGNTFSGNTATGATAGSGGGTFCSGTTITLSGNTFSGNKASGSIYSNGGNGYNSGYAGGAGANCAGTLILSNNTFVSNSIIGNPASGFGGGAMCYSSATNPMIIFGNTLQQNSAWSGGGLFAFGPTIALLDNLVVNNAGTNASSQGGGIWVDATSNLFMINNTVTGNTSAESGGGVAYIVTGTVELLNVYNNIIWGNLATSSGGDVYLSGTGKKKVFDFNDADSYYGVWDIAQNNIDASPQFFNPVGGDCHTQSSSPCANTGTNGAPFQPLMDLDGNSRTNSAGLVDMGCYEFNNTTTHPADTNGDFVISPAEFNTYAAAWKNGQAWTNGPNPGPNPIPANYVTRAGYLMTNGGTYTNVGSARPVNWQIAP